MKDVKVCVLRIEGTNCEDEMAEAFNMVGANAEKVHLKQLIGKAPEELVRDLEDYDILALPGGFSAGDYVRAGAIFAARIKASLGPQLKRFVEEGKPVLGVCNGFQIPGGTGIACRPRDDHDARTDAALYKTIPQGSNAVRRFSGTITKESAYSPRMWPPKKCS